MDEEQFSAFVRNVKERALYDTGVDARYGDILMTLCTCDKSISNGRFFVVAKRINA